MLERCDGFDTDAFPGGGEDTDLAWRAIESGTPAVFAPEAHVFHAVHRLGPRRHLKRAWHWTDTILAYARHPGLRQGHLFRGAFWKVEHYALLRVLIVPLLPRRLRLLRRWFVWRYTADLLKRGHAGGQGRSPCRSCRTSSCTTWSSWPPSSAGRSATGPSCSERRR